MKKKQALQTTGKQADLIQVKHPQSDRYVKINQTLGEIISQKKSAGPYKNIRIVKKFPGLARYLARKTMQKDGATSPVKIKNSHADKQCVFCDEEAGVWLYQADCLKFMDALIADHPQGKFDMIFADPPYFLSNGGVTCQAGRMVKVNKGDWDQSQGAESNHAFNLAWLLRCQKLLRPNGTIWVSGTHHVIHSIGYAMQQLRMKVLNDITWEKPNPPPNLSCRYFTHSTETIIWATKNEKSKHRFNYQDMRQENNGKQMKTVWHIKPPTKAEREFGKHPTQKPYALLERIILASTGADDLVFDPFAGSATTAIAALCKQRKFIGCETEKNYLQIAKKRLKAALKKRDAFRADKEGIKESRRRTRRQHDYGFEL